MLDLKRVRGLSYDSFDISFELWVIPFLDEKKNTMQFAISLYV